ncbi:hypothetical protein RHS01_07835 [Rhizoctonia solani]|uniref:Uncharacterized protein n=1 Tax=Rhizoctonia solani TaxID=456999 RepID=A0A8H7I8A8_9AGAM|nr:hypothetical protein RHS01_07835 [Rhizoctonia solani]
MKHLVSISPFYITCLRIIKNLANKLRSSPTQSELAHQLPTSWDFFTITDNIPRSPVEFAASFSHSNAEFITLYLIHSAAPTNPWPDQLMVDKRLPSSSKKAAARIIKNKIEIAKANRDGNTVHSPPNGHASVLSTTSKVGLGYIVKYGRKHWKKDLTAWDPEQTSTTPKC